MVNAHQGDQPLTLGEATEQLKEAWTRENGRKIVAWNAQMERDQAEQNEQNRATQEEDDIRCAQQEREAKEQRQEAERKKPKLNPFDTNRPVTKWIESMPAPYTLNKLNNLEYIELDYFMMRGCREAAICHGRSVFAFTFEDVIIRYDKCST